MEWSTVTACTAEDKKRRRKRKGLCILDYSVFAHAYKQSVIPEITGTPVPSLCVRRKMASFVLRRAAGRLAPTSVQVSFYFLPPFTRPFPWSRRLLCFIPIRAHHPTQRWASAAAVPLTESPPYYEGAEPDARKPPEPVKVRPASLTSQGTELHSLTQVAKLSNGVTVASLETHSFSSTLSVYVRAGSRYETYPQQGLTHLLRNTAFLVSWPCLLFLVCMWCVCVCVGCWW